MHACPTCAQRLFAEAAGIRVGRGGRSPALRAAVAFAAKPRRQRPTARAQASARASPADGGPMLERVVAQRFDGIEHGQAAAAEKFQVHAQLGVTRSASGASLGKKSAGARDQILHQRGVTCVETPRLDILGVEAVTRRRRAGM